MDLVQSIPQFVSAITILAAIYASHRSQSRRLAALEHAVRCLRDDLAARRAARPTDCPRR